MKLTERKEDWIHIIQPDDANRIASPAYIKKLLGIDILESSVRSEIENVKWHIKELEKPMRKQKVLELLKSGEHHCFEWFQNRSYPPIELRDLEELVAEGKLEVILQPKNKRKLFGLKREEKVE